MQSRPNVWCNFIQSNLEQVNQKERTYVLVTVNKYFVFISTQMQLFMSCVILLDLTIHTHPHVHKYIHRHEKVGGESIHCGSGVCVPDFLMSPQSWERQGWGEFCPISAAVSPASHPDSHFTRFISHRFTETHNTALTNWFPNCNQYFMMMEGVTHQPTQTHTHKHPYQYTHIYTFKYSFTHKHAQSVNPFTSIHSFVTTPRDSRYRCNTVLYVHLKGSLIHCKRAGSAMWHYCTQSLASLEPAH